MPERGRLLVVDDVAEMATLLKDKLTDAGYSVQTAENGEEAVRIFEKGLYDLVMTDVRMGQLSGFDLMEHVRGVDPLVPIIMMTAFGGIETAIECIKKGAFHYLTKPFRLDEVLLFVERALRERGLQEENRTLRRAASRGDDSPMVGSSAAMEVLRESVARVARSNATVLIRGESGTGKELVARAIHEQGSRLSEPFIPVNCTALTESLLESELFGHVRGAFTGARINRRGLFVEANGGTLFLDEIGDMSLSIQAKLLRVLEDGVIRAVGSDTPRNVDVRVIAATHQDLPKRIASGQFREDLFFRLNVVPISVPPLRARLEDLQELVSVFLRRAKGRNPSSPVTGINSELMDVFARHSWTGNVRELENFVERLVITGNEPLATPAMLQFELNPATRTPATWTEAEKVLPLRVIQDGYIQWAVGQCGGNKTKAAELLEIDVSTIHRREKER